MRLSLIIIVLLCSLNISAENKLREPLKWTELKLAACDVLTKNYSDISLQVCKRMNSFVVEKRYEDIATKNIITGIGIELENKDFNCLLFANRKVFLVLGNALSISDWSVDEDLRTREQGCIEIAE